MRYRRYTTLFVAALAAIAVARPALAGTTADLHRRLARIVAMIDRAEDRLETSNTSISAEARIVLQLERDLDEGRDPKEVIRELEFVSARLDDIEADIRVIESDLSNAGTHLERIAVLAELKEDKELLSKVRLAFRELAGVEDFAAKTGEKLTQVRGEVERVMRKARSR